MYVPSTPRPCGSHVKLNGLVICTYDVDNHTSKCTHSHWPLHLVSCRSNLPCQNTATKCCTGSAPHCAREKGNDEYIMYCTLFYCVKVHDIVYICMHWCEYNTCQLSACLICVKLCVCVQVCIYVYVGKMSLIYCSQM